MKFQLEDWTCERITTLSAQQQLAMARRISGNLLQDRVLLGRCLLTIDRSESYAECGCNSALHYALLELGQSERSARDAMRAALRLENLSRLTEAV